MTQEADTADRITVRDAVELGRTPFLSALRPWGASDDAAVASALSSVDMAALAARDWATLSGGERQRAHIARALAQQPRVLLLDEPNNHLDIHHQLQMLRMVATLPVTTVVALHDLNQAMSCDRLLVMQGGRAVALGTPAEVLTPELLRHVFDVRTAFLRDPADGAPRDPLSPPDLRTVRALPPARSEAGRWRMGRAGSGRVAGHCGPVARCYRSAKTKRGWECRRDERCWRAPPAYC